MRNSYSAVELVIWSALTALVTASVLTESVNNNKSEGMEELIPHLPNGSIEVAGCDKDGRVKFNIGETLYTAEPAQELSAESFGPTAGTNLLKMVRSGSIRHARKVSDGR